MSERDDWPWTLAESGSERARIFDATLEHISEHGFVGVTLDAVAARAGISGEQVTAHFESSEILFTELALEASWRAVDAFYDDVVASESGTEALEQLMRGQVSFFSSQPSVLFQISRTAPQILPDRYVLHDRHRAAYAGFGPTALAVIERKLIDEWGETQLPQGIDPRRLVFVALMVANGYLDFKGWLESRGIQLRHDDADVIEEMARAICSPPRIIAQLSALNRASALLVGMQTRAELLEKAPALLVDALDLDGAALALEGHELVSTDSLSALDTDLRSYLATLTGLSSTTYSVELGLVVCPVAVGESTGGLLIAHRRSEDGLDQQLATRLETFASMVGLALENLRIVENLNELVEQRTRELREAQAALVQAEKMASLGQLVAGVAHELNTPLGAVASSRDSMSKASERVKSILEAELGDAWKDHKRLRRAFDVLENTGEVIGTGTARIEAIVTRLRSFARLDQAELQSVSLEECIEDALAITASSLGGIEVERSFADTPKIRCYPARLNQVFANVIHNAIDAMDGGRIRVSTSTDGARVSVTIEDDGHGIEEDNLVRVFDPGYTTRSVGVGTGLGLPTAYQIISDHGGTISIESEPGVGTTVRITLPTSS